MRPALSVLRIFLKKSAGKCAILRAAKEGMDDEREIADLVALYLKNEGYETLVCYNGQEALEQIQAGPVDLAILDVMLPEISGFELCRRIRERYQYPVIMLTAKGEELDKINGLSLGADDYVTKPFLPLELVARVKAQLRRYKRYNGEFLQKEPLTCGGLVIDVETHQASLNGAPLSLTPTEFSLLAALCESKGKVVSSEELFRRVWGEAITVHIRHLREKLGDSFERPKYIKTVWGVGYEMDA